MALQLPALSRVQRWKYQVPSSKVALVVDSWVSSTSLTWSQVPPALLSKKNE